MRRTSREDKRRKRPRTNERREQPMDELEKPFHSVLDSDRSRSAED
jgi:hypothetical protein